MCVRVYVCVHVCVCVCVCVDAGGCMHVYVYACEGWRGCMLASVCEEVRGDRM